MSSLRVPDLPIQVLQLRATSITRSFVYLHTSGSEDRQPFDSFHRYRPIDGIRTSAFERAASVDEFERQDRPPESSPLKPSQTPVGCATPEVWHQPHRGSTKATLFCIRRIQRPDPASETDGESNILPTSLYQLGNNCGQPMCLFRYGRSEFVALLTADDDEMPSRVARRVHRSPCWLRLVWGTWTRFTSNWVGVNLDDPTTKPDLTNSLR